MYLYILTSIMPSLPPPLYPTQTKLLTELGQRLREARLRRRFSSATVAARAGIARATLTRVEAGDPSVTMGTYLRVLAVLGLERSLAVVAADDVLGRQLQDAGLPSRQRAPKRPAAVRVNSPDTPSETSKT